MITAPLLLPNIERLEGKVAVWREDSLNGKEKIHQGSKEDQFDTKCEFFDVTQSSFDKFNPRLLESARVAPSRYAGKGDNEQSAESLGRQFRF